MRHNDEAQDSQESRPGREEGESRSIRNISAPTRQRPRPDARMPRERQARTRSRWWLWAIAGACVVALAALLLLALRDTRVVVVPRTHAVTFTSGTQYLAMPAASAATSSLAYAVESFELEESATVPSQGTVRVEEKAHGTITVYNNYSTNPMRLIQNTRFQTPDGLVFRAPSEVVVPGRSGSTPGQVEITVIADQVGESYNVGPVERFTLPGLAGSAEFNSVYARSSEPMTGGFAGERPGIAPADLQAAISGIRDRLAAQARERARSVAGEDRIALTDLIQITYQDLPQTAEAGGGARVYQRALVRVPVFQNQAFAAAVARGVSADAEGASVRLVPSTGFAASATATSTTLGAENISFTMSGGALLVWQVDAEALAEALSGKDQDAFEAIVDAFPGVQEATARIQPFWKRTFPAAADIVVDIQDPSESAQ